MTNEQLNTLKELMQDADFKGKNTLGWLIWRNTYKPKYKVGDFVKTTDYSHRIYGHQVINHNAKVIAITFWQGDRQPHYELEAVYKIDGKEDYITKLYSLENTLGEKTNSNVNYLGEQKSKYSDETTPTGLGI